MKFLLMALAMIMSCHFVWGSGKELRLPAPLTESPNYAVTTCKQIKLESLGNSLNSPPETGQGELEKSSDSPPNRELDADLTDQFDDSTDVSFVPTPQQSGGSLTPQATGKGSPPLKPEQVGSLRNTDMLKDPLKESLPRPLFSETTYNLRRGIICIGSIVKLVQSQGPETPCLHYIQSFSPNDMDKVADLYEALTMNMEGAIDDFIRDCRMVKITLTPEQAEAILGAVRVDLFYIKNPKLRRGLHAAFPLMHYD